MPLNLVLLNPESSIFVIKINLEYLFGPLVSIYVKFKFYSEWLLLDFVFVIVSSLGISPNLYKTYLSLDKVTLPLSSIILFPIKILCSLFSEMLPQYMYLMCVSQTWHKEKILSHLCSPVLYMRSL